jgi:hypothetical protein
MTHYRSEKDGIFIVFDRHESLFIHELDGYLFGNVRIKLIYITLNPKEKKFGIIRF